MLTFKRNLPLPLRLGLKNNIFLKASDFNSYVKVHQQSIFRFVHRIIGDRELAKDIVQDAFEKLWTHGKDIQSDKVRPWLYTTSRRICLLHIKQNKNMLDISTLELDLFKETNHDDFDLQQVIERSLDLLSELQKSTLMLRDYEGYAYEEIANILAISEESVKVHLFRARQKIRAYIKDLKWVL